jgi:hypothetical protein
MNSGLTPALAVQEVSGGLPYPEIVDWALQLKVACLPHRLDHLL